MRKFIFIVSMTLGASCSTAQPVSYESMRLADVLVQSSWQSLEQTMPTVVAGIEAQLRATGTSEKFSKVFAAELGKAMNRESLTKAYAQVITNSMSVQDAKDITSFLQTSLGKKYLDLGQALSSNMNYVKPIFKEACLATIRQVGNIDKSMTTEQCERM